MGRARRAFFVLTILFLAAPLLGQSPLTPQQKTSRYLETVRHQPGLLLAFLSQLPKGGDLHNHLGGSNYAENLIDFAAQEGLCLDRATWALHPAPCNPSCTSDDPAVQCTYRDQALYNSVIDAWSMRNWQPGRESAHDHFFATFDKFALALEHHVGDALAETMRRAAADHVEYLELMHIPDGLQSARLGEKLAWTPDFAAMRSHLLAAGLIDIVAAARAQLDRDEAQMRSALHCDTVSPDPACGITVRYLYPALRGRPPAQVFAQMVAGFEMASADPRYVGVNLVMPEDWYVPRLDFHLHMQMLDYLHSVYPRVHISLHAGELAMGLVPPEDLSFHIRESVELGHAERIGHGVDVMNERQPLALLREMARRNILVEICLTSNAQILGVEGDTHPFPIYRRYHVPVALATDDEGVARSEMTHEYLRAVENYDLSYADLKELARQSLEHSFLPGASFWSDTRPFRAVAACASNRAGSSGSSPTCQSFLEASPKARMQWKLEQQFADFENGF